MRDFSRENCYFSRPVYSLKIRGFFYKKQFKPDEHRLPLLFKYVNVFGLGIWERVQGLLTRRVRSYFRPFGHIWTVKSNK